MEFVFVTKTDVLNNHLARSLSNSNQHWTMEMRVEVLSSEGAQIIDTIGYQVSGLEDIEVHWEDPDLNVDAKFRPGISTPFSNSTFNTF